VPHESRKGKVSCSSYKKKRNEEIKSDTGGEAEGTAALCGVQKRAWSIKQAPGGWGTKFENAVKWDLLITGGKAKKKGRLGGASLENQRKKSLDTMGGGGDDLFPREKGLDSEKAQVHGSAKDISASLG